MTSNDQSNLTDFLLARIAEDEAAAARAGSFTPWTDTFQNDNYGHLTIQPDRVLAECEAKRRIVEWHVPDRHLENWYWPQRKCVECGGLWHVIKPFGVPTEIGPEQGCRTLRALAVPYADHPDYREEWRP